MTTPTRGSAEERSGGEAIWRIREVLSFLADEARACCGNTAEREVLAAFAACDRLAAASPAWTSEPPKVEGWYWVEWADGSEPDVMLLCPGHSTALLIRRYAGPISMPPLPKPEVAP